MDCPPSPILSPPPCSTNIIVLSSAGKPIFSRYPLANNGSLVTISGLVQAILSFATSLETNIKTILTTNETYLFLQRGSVFLLAISPSPSISTNYLALLLEYAYSQILFTLTSKIQKIFQKSAGFDLTNLFGEDSHSVLCSLLDTAESSGSLLLQGVTILPLPPPVRKEASRVLLAGGKMIENTLFSLLLDKKGRLISLVMPAQIENQLQPSDAHLISNFFASQPGLLASESWLPVCLPR